MKDARSIIVRPVISERSYDRIQDNVYTFEVLSTANKIEIRNAVEKIFDVKVINVNVLNVKPKPKRQRYIEGKTRAWKKAMVTLKEGDKIELFSN